MNTARTFNASLLFATATLVSQGCLAQAEAVPTMAYGKIFLSLITIILLIVSLAWIAKRFNLTGVVNHKAIKVHATIPVGTKEKLLLVDVEGQRLLLGVTAGQINTLHSFTPQENDFSEEGVLDEESKCEPNSKLETLSPTVQHFSTHLSKILKKGLVNEK